jgi:hypothetical protein
LRVLNTMNATLPFYDYPIRHDSASGRRGPPAPPLRHRMALVTWVGAWAVVTLSYGCLGPVIGESPLALRSCTQDRPLRS